MTVELRLHHLVHPIIPTVKPIVLLLSLAYISTCCLSAEVIEGEMAGYLFGPAEKVPEEFNGGLSLYAAA